MKGVKGVKGVVGVHDTSVSADRHDPALINQPSRPLAPRDLDLIPQIV